MGKPMKSVTILVLLCFLTSCAGTSKYAKQKEDNPIILKVFDSRAYTAGYESRKAYSQLAKYLEDEISRPEIDPQELVPGNMSQHDPEGKLYALDDFSELYTRGLVNFKKAYEYNQKALKFYQTINEIGLENVPLSLYFNGRRNLYYFFYPSPEKKTTAEGRFFGIAGLVSDYPRPFLQTVRKDDFENVGKRILERKAYLDKKLGITQDKAPTQTTLIKHDTEKGQSPAEDVTQMEQLLDRLHIYDSYYRNFYLASMLWRSKKLQKPEDYEKLIALCEEGISAKQKQRVGQDINSLNMYHYYLGISYLKIGENRKGINHLESFLKGLDSADRLDTRSVKRNADVVKKIFEREKQRAETKKIVGTVLGVLLAVSFIALGAYAGSTGATSWFQAADSMHIGVFGIGEQLQSFGPLPPSFYSDLSSKLKGVVSPTTLKALRYLNKHELVELYVEMGKAYQANDNKREAIRFYEEALAIIESQRTTIATETQRISFADAKSYLYKNIVQLLVQSGEEGKAFEYVERSKSRAFLDVLGGNKVILKTDEINDAYASILRHKEEISALFDNVKIGRDQILDALDKRSRSIQVRTRIDRNDFEFRSMVDVETISVEEVKSLSQGDFSILEYFITDNAIFIFLFDEGRLLVKKKAIERTKLFCLIKSFRDSLVSARKNEDPLRDAKSLYDILLAPVISSISKKRVYIVPHGWLHYVPFQALHDGKKYMVSDYAFTYCPSATTISIFLSKKSSELNSALIMANPTLGNSLNSLPFAEEEALSLSKLFTNNEAFIGIDATETNFKQLSGKYDILHLATHASFNPNDPMNSLIYLTGDKINDGELTALELYQLNLKASLITLSACKTGLSLVSEGDDVIGLVRGAAYAGAKSIVSTLWSVDDESTMHVMSNFYKNLKTMPLDLALQEAQREAMERYHNPFNWSPFILIGNYDPKNLSRGIIKAYAVALQNKECVEKRPQAVAKLCELASQGQKESSLIFRVLKKAGAIKPLKETIISMGNDSKQKVMRNLWKSDNPIAIRIFLDCYTVEDPGCLVFSQEALIKPNSSQNTLDALILGLKDKDYQVRIKSAELIGKLRDNRGVEPLISVMANDIPVVRMAAIRSLGEIGDTAAVGPIANALKDENASVRGSAAVALRKIDHPEGEQARFERERGEFEQAKTEFERKERQTQQERIEVASVTHLVGRDGVYVAYANGIVKDTSTGLEWKVGPDKDMTWDEARSWVQSLGGDWRMPTLDQLEGLYKKGMGSHNLTSFLKATSSKNLWAWSGETKGSSKAWVFLFSHGARIHWNRNYSIPLRAFAVRSRGDG